MLHKRWIKLMLVLIITGIFFNQCMKQPEVSNDNGDDAKGKEYAAKTTCVNCRVDVVKSYADNA